MISEETNHSDAWLFIVIGCSDSSVIHTNTHTHTHTHTHTLLRILICCFTTSFPWGLNDLRNEVNIMQACRICAIHFMIHS